MFVPKTYLGDSVYAEIEGGSIKLTTNNGTYDSNTIILEDEVVENLREYIVAVQTEDTK